MRHITSAEHIQLTHTAIAIGKFDGFHRGHQMLLDQVHQWQDDGLTGVIFTFAPANDRIGTGRHIDTVEEKRKKAEATGLDVLLEYPFTKEFADTEPEDFVRDILIGQLGVKAVAVGSDFRFGKQRTGDAVFLKKLGDRYGFQVKVFDKLRVGKTEVSSSVIRQEIETGRMEAVSAYLGMPYTVSGEVIHGQALGKTIGMPTANLSLPPDKILPPLGVYVSAIRRNKMRYYGISNLGCKPTVSDEQRLGLETYLFDFQEDLYGEEISVELLHFLRQEQRFETMEMLTEQMKQDVRAARSWLLQFT